MILWKKDILRGFIALVFIFLTLLSCALLKEFKGDVKELDGDNGNNESNKFYGYNLENTTFNLPVVIINTNGNSVKRQEDITADMQVYDSNNNTLNEEPSLESRINISIRGNSTSKYPKSNIV